MTAGSNGVPEEDDPFAYLYRPAGGEGAHDDAAPTAPVSPQQPGVPRTSYAHPTQVGRAQYGQPRQPQAGYGQSVPQQAPYAQHSRPQPAPGGGHGGHSTGGGGRSRGLIFGGIAVVAAIAIGASVAFMSGGGDDTSAQKAAGSQVSTAPTGGASTAGSPSTSGSPDAPSTKPVVDVSGLTVQNGTMASQITGAKSSDGKYVTLAQGTTITWTLQMPKDGSYSIWAHYDNPGADTTAAVTVNGESHPGGIKLTNWAKSDDPAKAWVSSYLYADLKSGANTVVFTCDNAACAGLQVDEVAVTPRSVTDFPD